MQKNKKNLLIAGAVALVVLAITGLVLTQGQNSTLQGFLPPLFRSGTLTQDPTRGGQIPPGNPQQGGGQVPGNPQGQAGQGNQVQPGNPQNQNQQQPLGNQSQIQNLVVQVSAQQVGGQKNPKVSDAIASFDVLSNNQALVVIKSMTFNIKGDNSPEKNVTNYELWANGTKLTADVGVNFNDKTVTFNNILVVDIGSTPVTIPSKTQMNFVVKATTSNVLSGKKPGASVSLTLGVKTVAFSYDKNASVNTAEFNPAVLGQVSTYTK